MFRGGKKTYLVKKNDVKSTRKEKERKAPVPKEAKEEKERNERSCAEPRSIQPAFIHF